MIDAETAGGCLAWLGLLILGAFLISGWQAAADVRRRARHIIDGPCCDVCGEGLHPYFEAGQAVCDGCHAEVVGVGW